MANDERTNEMQEQLNQLRQAIASDVAGKIEASEHRLREGLTLELARQLETAQKHLEGCMQTHAEDLKDLVTKAANHVGRIVALEQATGLQPK